LSARLDTDDPQREQRAALLRLALIVGAGVLAAVVTGVARTVAVVGAIVVIIMLHELGHLLTAKWSGMKVTEYFLGFGPRLWSIRRGETEYGIKAIPAGGYVRIIGMNNLEEVDPVDEQRTYRAASFPRRLLVVSAGSLVHFLLAYVLLVILLSVVGVYSPDSRTVASTTVQGITTPAQQAGLRPGDQIVALDGKPMSSWDQLPAFVHVHAGQPVTITVLRDGRQLDLRAVPRDLVAAPVAGADVQVPTTASSYGFLGVSGPAPVVEHIGVLKAVPQAGADFGRTVGSVFTAFHQVFSKQGLASYTNSITGHDATSAQSGPRLHSIVGIAQFASDAAHSGLRDVLWFLVILNVFIGVFNLIPLLPFDGGHVAIAIYERLRSRAGRRYRVDIRKWAPVSAFVLLALVLVAAVSTWADIFHPPPNPFQ